MMSYIGLTGLHPYLESLATTQDDSPMSQTGAVPETVDRPASSRHYMGVHGITQRSYKDAPFIKY